SVVGDTTTTMMWIDGVPALDVIHAYVAAVPTLLVIGVFAAIQQHAYQPIQRDEVGHHEVQWKRLTAVLLILIGAIITNVTLDFPAAGVWVAIVISAFFVATDWKVVPASMKGTLFLLTLVLCASMMPVETLPPASWQTAFGLGWVSSVFDNIPLTKLALDQGGYDWGVLAFTVGYGGSMVWFGSSAGVAISNIFPEARSVVAWIKRGWFVPLAYVVGFFVMLWLWGWKPLVHH
ncbi:MAG: citrate transporter, partial [Gammaproteobacteria bacterium]